MIITRTPLRISLAGGGSDLLLFNVSPYSVLDDCLDRFTIGFVPASKLTYGYPLLVLLAHITDVLLCKARTAVQLATHYLFRVLARVMVIAARQSLRHCPRWVAVAARVALGVSVYAVTALCCHIPHIIRMRTEKHVFRVAAWWIVATMQNPKAIRDRSVRHFVGNPVGQVHGSLVAHLAVAVVATAQGPWPALIGTRHVNMRPKALRKCLGKSILRHVGSSFQLSAVPRGVSAPPWLPDALNYTTDCMHLPVEGAP